MKNFFVGLGLLMCLISGCVKSNNGTVTCGFTDSKLVAPANEVDSVQKYLTLHSITATPNSAGFFYTINSQGTGPAIANLCTGVAVSYTGRLTNGAVFDSTGTGVATFQLGQLIPAWQKGLPLITKGGTITLYVPPTLGYGSTDVKNNAGVVVIPANSVLIFDIDLIDVQ